MISLEREYCDFCGEERKGIENFYFEGKFMKTVSNIGGYKMIAYPTPTKTLFVCEKCLDKFRKLLKR